jgi:carnosine N-methyltransferase
MKQFEYLDGIPVYVDDLIDYATEAYYLYSSLIVNQRKLRDELKIPQVAGKRGLVLANMQHAIDVNLKSITLIQKALQPYIDPIRLVEFKPNPNDNLSAYLKDFKYMKRDWTGHPESEQQLATIRQSISGYIRQFSDENDNAVFVGAGLARVAFDLADLYKTVYVTDKSFSMAFHYNLLLKQDIEFYEIDDKNVYDYTDVTRRNIASVHHLNLPEPELKKRLEKIQYFIADARDLPFENSSVGALYSVYFTDIIAISHWLTEIKRILKPNGLFIHFGPLDYFFSDITQMLSATEIREYFEDNGFECLVDESVEAVHLPNGTLTNKIYKNWLFIARRVSEPPLEIDADAIFEITGEVRYRISGSVGNGVSHEHYELQFPNGEVYEGAETVLDIVRQLQEGKSFQQLLDTLKDEYGEISDASVTHISDILKLLISNKVIRQTASIHP